VFHSLKKYSKAKQFLEKSLAISKEIGHKEGEASSYRYLGVLCHTLGEFEKAKSHLEIALSIRKENFCGGCLSICTETPLRAIFPAPLFQI